MNRVREQVDLYKEAHPEATVEELSDFTDSLIREENWRTYMQIEWERKIQMAGGAR